MATRETGVMERAGGKRRTRAPAAGEIEEVLGARLAFHDDLAETAAWTALVMDGVCGALGSSRRTSMRTPIPGCASRRSG